MSSPRGVQSSAEAQRGPEVGSPIYSRGGRLQYFFSVLGVESNIKKISGTS